MSNFKGKFSFDWVKNDLNSERNRVRRFVLYVMDKTNARYISIAGINIDLISQAETRLAKVSDETLHEIIEEGKKIFV